ncbi:MAG: hypothetical protein ABEJ42_04700 [Halobacteriaceae archaeon]
MAHTDTLWHRLERRAATCFLVGGMLLVGSPTHIVLEEFVGVALPTWFVAGIVLTGLVAVFLGVLGVTRSLRAPAPTLALASAVLAAVAAVEVTALLAWIFGAALPAGTDWLGGGPPDAAFVAVAVTATLAFVGAGGGSLRTGVPSRRVGALLLLAASPWLGTLGATAVWGSAVPPWVALLVYLPVPVAALGTRVALRERPVGGPGPEATGRSATG